MELIKMKQLAAELLKITIEQVEENSGVIDDNGTLYVSIPIKGGCSLMIDCNGYVLYADSSISFSEMQREFKNGRRTPLSSFN